MNPKPVEQEVPERVNLLLVAQVRAMLQNEAYHYCADCHTHCRQTILAAEATKEAAQAYDKLIARHAKVVEALRDIKEAAFALHVGDKHKPDAFAACVHPVCYAACRAWNEAVAQRDPKDGRETS